MSDIAVEVRTRGITSKHCHVRKLTLHGLSKPLLTFPSPLVALFLRGCANASTKGEIHRVCAEVGGSLSRRLFLSAGFLA